MTMAWRPPQKRAKVQRILKKHDVFSGRCDQAAKAIWPLAKGQDTAASYWFLLPDPYAGPWLLTNDVPSRFKWAYHVCVSTESHAVCAMTGADGLAADCYVQEKFQYPDGVSKVEIVDTAELTAMLEGI